MVELETPEILRDAVILPRSNKYIIISGRKTIVNKGFSKFRNYNTYCNYWVDLDRI